jgi:hypothetical protein
MTEGPTQTRVKTVALWLAEAMVRRADGHPLHLTDDVLARSLGWMDSVTGERFDISLVDAHGTSHNLSKRVRALIQTPEGRQHLLTASLKPPEIMPEVGIVLATDQTPVIEAARPLTVAPFADAFALVEGTDQLVDRIEIHPDDYAEALKDEGFALEDPEKGALQARTLWGALVIPTLVRPKGSVLLIGRAQEAGLSTVALIEVEG